MDNWKRHHPFLVSNYCVSIKWSLMCPSQMHHNCKKSQTLWFTFARVYNFPIRILRHCRWLQAMEYVSILCMSILWFLVWAIRGRLGQSHTEAEWRLYGNHAILVLRFCSTDIGSIPFFQFQFHSVNSNSTSNLSIPNRTIPYTLLELLVTITPPGKSADCRHHKTRHSGTSLVWNVDLTL